MKVLVTTSSFAEYSDTPLQRLQSKGIVVEQNTRRRRLLKEECLALFKDFDGILAGTETISREILGSAPKIRVISRVGAGLDNVDLEAASERGIRVYSTPDAPTLAVAELTLALMLDLLRSIAFASSDIRHGQWNKKTGELLTGKVLGILGLGKIGKKLVELTSPFHLKYLAWDKTEDPAFAKTFGVTYVTLDELLKHSDIVSIHLSLQENLRHIMGKRELLKMKSSAFLINTARGGLVSEEALYRALKEGTIQGAALDVYETEPYLGPLRHLDNAILTPHIGSYAREARVEMEMEAVENLLKGLGLA